MSDEDILQKNVYDLQQQLVMANRRIALLTKELDNVKRQTLYIFKEREAMKQRMEEMRLNYSSNMRVSDES